MSNPAVHTDCFQVRWVGLALTPGPRDWGFVRSYARFLEGDAATRQVSPAKVSCVFRRGMS